MIKIADEIYKILENILTKETTDQKINFFLSLGLMVSGDITIEEAAACSHMTPTHYAFYLEQLKIPKNPLIDEAMIDLMVLQDEAELHKLRGQEQDNKEKKQIVETEAFTVVGNTITIHAGYRQFWGIKNSIKEAGGVYNNKQRNWYLSDDKLDIWLKSQRKYGWLKNYDNKRN